MKSKGPDRLTLLAFGVMVLLGGSNFVAVRFSNRELAPFWGAGVRFALAAVVLMSMVAVRRLALPRGRALVGAALFGILNFTGAYAFLYWGLQEIPAGFASIVLATMPLVTLLFVNLHRLEPFTWRGVIGALLAAGGIAIMSAEKLSGRTPLLSVLALVAGAACIAESGVVIKLHPQSDPVTTNAAAMTIGSVLLLVLSAASGEAWELPKRPETWVALLYMTVLGSVGLFMLVIWVLNRWTASATSYSFVLLPFVTTLESVWLDDETVSWALVFGAVFVILGVYFGAFSSRQPVPAERERL